MIILLRLGQNFVKFGIKLFEKIRSAKSDYENRISNSLQTNTTNIKTWWKLSKQVLNLGKGNEPIPDLKYNNMIIENDQEKAEILNEYFINQSKLDDANKSPPELAEPTYERLNRVNITSTDVRDILKSLNPSKASGPDLKKYAHKEYLSFQKKGVRETNILKNNLWKSVDRFCRYGHVYISQCHTMEAAILFTLSRGQNRKILIQRTWFSFCI